MNLNIEHRTPNIEHRKIERAPFAVRRSMFDVGCSMFSFGSWSRCAICDSWALPMNRTANRPGSQRVRRRQSAGNIRTVSALPTRCGRGPSAVRSLVRRRGRCGPAEAGTPCAPSAGSRVHGPSSATRRSWRLSRNSRTWSERCNLLRLWQVVPMAFGRSCTPQCKTTRQSSGRRTQAPPPLQRR
jgi:hypothetical protein